MRRFFALLWAFLVACGARTGLDAVGPPEEGDPSPHGGVLRLDAGERDAASIAPVACVPGELQLTRAVPTVLFVLDRSLSMQGRLANGRDSRWNALKHAITATLPSVDDRVSAGALFFPDGPQSRDAESCTVSPSPALSPALDSSGAIIDAMNATGPGGATPTADAVRAASNHLGSLRAASTARALVLATDGAPDCNANLDANTCECLQGQRRCAPERCLDDTRTTTIIADVLAHGIPTYVVGLLGNDDETRFGQVLGNMAKAGGRPRDAVPAYYPANSQSDLDDAFATIRDQVGACVYLTASVPDASGTIVVTIDGAVVPYDPTGKQGWSWANQQNGEIVFAGNACAGVTGRTVAAVVTCADAGP
jgi:hypothetical protein